MPIRNINGLLKDMKRQNKGDDTPRTDDECFSGPYGSEVHVTADLVRQLKRELNIALSKLRECERQIIQIETKNVGVKDDVCEDCGTSTWIENGDGVYDYCYFCKLMEDKRRLDWLQSGHGVVALSKKLLMGGTKNVFAANFEEQDWDEHEDVRVAIDIAMNRSNKCPKCGSHTQVWVNQNTKKLTCHRWGCNNVELE